jgi:acyl transferase domain-containing protein/acyl carrier protein/NAD(P)-dependent dehydrogenase (short-subunit alcohol dehydrogenase family)
MAAQRSRRNKLHERLQSKRSTRGLTNNEFSPQLSQERDMENTAHRAIAIVGAGAILPDAPNVASFWENIKAGRYSVSEVDPERWNPAFYYDPDPRVPDKTYSKIGGWVRDFAWDPMKWHLPIPPRVADAMDTSQKWGIACTRQALDDYRYPERPLDPDRTAVILGNAMGGERHYFTVMRVYFPEYAEELQHSESFAALPEAVRKNIAGELRQRMGKHLPEITEDSMPGELANCIAGRIANIFNFHGPNFVCDAACASAMAAIGAAAQGLAEHEFDFAITGGIDRNMGVSTFVKFCKIGALSATGTRPYAEGADGFVMGEGAALFLMKRLADAERDGDHIYAVLRGIGGSSDGKGKGITAPNPVGQKFAIERAWKNAGLSPATATYIEGHGTSTRVGDVVEVESMASVLGKFQLPVQSVALGSVKSNFGHLKGAAGAAGMLKAVLALRDKVLPPSTHCEHPNPDIDFEHSPLFVNRELQPWSVVADGVRRAGLSAFGFGGTNFHAVLEEYIPHRLNGNGKHKVMVSEMPAKIEEIKSTPKLNSDNSGNGSVCKTPLRGALVVGGASMGEVAERLRAIEKEAKEGRAPTSAAPAKADLRAPERVAIDYADAAELANKSATALKALAANQPAMWKALRAQGIFAGHGPAPKVAFLYPGQGSQYLNMLRPLKAVEPIIAETFSEADKIMTPLLGKPLSDFVFVDGENAATLAKAEDDLRQTAITQPAVLTADLALTRLLAAYGIVPDFTMGHSLGEYGALIAAGAIPFEDALEAVSARGREMTRFSPDDKGRMAAVFAPLEEIETILKSIDGYVVVANINSEHQSVIGGSSKAVEQAMAALQNAGYDATALPVSHAFHTSIVAPASEPLRRVLERLRLRSPELPIVANVNGEFYPTGSDVVPKMLDILALQVAAPVQFIKGLRTLYSAGARMLVEVGPKKALQGFAEDVLRGKGDITSVFTNHPKIRDIVAFNQALCCLYASGLGRGVDKGVGIVSQVSAQPLDAEQSRAEMPAPPIVEAKQADACSTRVNGNRYAELGQWFSKILEQGWQIYRGGDPVRTDLPVTISGAALGLPGTERIFDDANVGRILRGEQFISSVPMRFREAMLDKHITRLVKNDNGGPMFEELHDVSEVIKLAGRGGAFDLETEFGISGERCAALDRVTRLAIGVGLDAMRDAGIPLVLRYKTTSKGTQLPDRWALPDALRDETGVIFASAFPGLNSFAEEISSYDADRARREQLAFLETLSTMVRQEERASALVQAVEARIRELHATIEKNPYTFDRRYLFRVLAMGHSQFAEYIGARGPNTAINAACASTTQAVALAEDWIRAGRCRRVIVVSADDVTSDQLIDWMSAGFLASGAAATDEAVEEAAIPFDRRRHGMIIGMGAAGLVVESAESVRERGMQAICEVLSAATANSAFHGTRLDVQHIGQVMESLVSEAERRGGIDRYKIAAKTVFMSHETYTPARGGSAAAEIFALRKVFGDTADRIVIANTKGFTGHAMGAGIEDVVAVKALETGLLPPVANFKEVDPELGSLNLSKGGSYPVEYALRLGAGFGSQISMTLLRWIKTKDEARRPPNDLGHSYRIVDGDAWRGWLTRMAGHAGAELEVVRRTLRMRQAGAESGRTQDSQQHVTVPVAVRQETAAAKVGDSVNEVNTECTTAVSKADSKTARPLSEVDAALCGSRVATQPQTTEPVTPKHPTPNPNSVRDRVLRVVSEKTGYPVDMLDVDLDLEADLGIDTVKQAEVFAAIRESYGIARDENRKLRDYPTLAHVIGFVLEQLSATGTVPTQETTEPACRPGPQGGLEQQQASSAQQASPAEDVKARVLSLVVEKTGYPEEMLDLDLDLEADLGIDTVKQAELFAAIREIYAIPRDENRKLRDYPTLAHVIRFVYEKRPDLERSSVEPPINVSSDGVGMIGLMKGDTTKLVTSPEAASTQAVPAAPASLIRDKVLDIVAEKTGYPKDMLDLDLDLEADLGIDTVKQAEMFAAIRAAYDIPRDENLKLREFPTLAHVIKFAEERSGKETEIGREVQLTGEAAGVDDKLALPQAEPKPVVAGASKFESVSAGPELVSTASIKEKVLEIVAEKTGYPKDMLDLDLDLEADLGIDTVKQAEMFAAIRAAYDIPRDESLKLREFPTLAHVIKFAHDRAFSTRNDAGVPVSVPLAKQAGIPTVVAHPVTPKRERRPLASLDAANAIPRRVPVPVLRPPLSVCQPTGVTLQRGSRVVIMPDNAGVADALTHLLQEKDVEVLRITATEDAERLTSELKRWSAEGRIQGVYWLPALDHEGDLLTMDLANWHAAVRLRVKSLYTVMRALYDEIARPGTFLVSATRLGGQHGYDRAGAVAPLGGGVTGFTKTYKRERIEAHVKAVDFAADCKAQGVARLLIEETLRDPAAVEIGYKDELRWTVGLQEQPAADDQPGMTLDEKTVFVITGAAGSIVSAITADLAAASGGTFYLLDIVPEPDPSSSDLARFIRDKEGLKRDLFARIQARGERATPALVEKELANVERARAALSAIDAVRDAGGNAHYCAVNLTDADAVTRVIEKVRTREGRIDVLLHAAGLDRSRSLADKDQREFDLVFDVKSDGLFNLLHAIADMPLGAVVAFSSIAGRFGNPGQTDYSSANDLLCKVVSNFRTTRPNTRGIAIDWTAWAGIGMATRGSIPKVMELAGIDMLHPEAGVPLIRRELTAGNTRGEVVIAERLGLLMNEWHPTGGIDTDAYLRASDTHISVLGPMMGKVVRMGIHSPMRIETVLDPRVQPFLHDHQIDGTPVLPGVMGIEAFAEAALRFLPGWHIATIEDVNFHAPFKFYRNEPRTLNIDARIRCCDESLVADCLLIGERQLPNHSELQTTTHFSGHVRLSRKIAEPASRARFERHSGQSIEARDIYRVYFHGPAYQVLDRVWWDGNRVIGLMAANLPGNHQPLEAPTLVAPRLIELCFQTAGIFEMGTHSRMGLPQHVDRITTFCAGEDAATGSRLYAVVTPNLGDGSFDAEVVDDENRRYLQLSGYRTIALPSADAQHWKALHALMSLEPAIA